MEVMSLSQVTSNDIILLTCKYQQGPLDSHSTLKMETVKDLRKFGNAAYIYMESPPWSRIHINPLKPTLIFVILKNSVCTSKCTPHFTIIKLS
jgi:hypothetical protein